MTDGKDDSPEAIAERIKAKMPSADELRAAMHEHEQDDEDRRCYRGKHAPPKGSCVFCAGEVTAAVRYRDTGVIGGPAPSGYIHHWECQNCGLLYGKLPFSK